MAYAKRTHRIYGAVTPEDFKIVQELASEKGQTAANWVSTIIQGKVDIRKKRSGK